MGLAPPRYSRFTVRHPEAGRTDDTFLSGNTQIVKKGEKTLGWPSTLSVLTKLDGFANRGYYSLMKDWMHIRSLFVSFVH